MACALPVIAPNTSGFFIVGITAFVKVTDVAKPIPVSSPNIRASLKEFTFTSFSKMATTIEVVKQEIEGTIKYILVSFQFSGLLKPLHSPTFFQKQIVCAKFH